MILFIIRNAVIFYILYSISSMIVPWKQILCVVRDIFNKNKYIFFIGMNSIVPITKI